MRWMLVISLFILMVSTANGQEGAQYVPDEVGREVVEAYLTSQVGDTQLDDARWNQAATIRSRVTGSEVVEGKRYLNVVGKYENHPVVREVVVYRRMDETGAYVLVMQSAAKTEWRYLKFPATVGQTWKNGENTMRIAEKISVTLPFGKFDNCLRVTEEWPRVDPNNVISGEQVYCPGLGQVRGVVTQDIRGIPGLKGQQTITRLVSVNRKIP